MLKELNLLVDAFFGEVITLVRAREAVVVNNVLVKKTQRTRQVTFKYLQRLYGLDEQNPQGLLFFQLFRTRTAAQGQLAALQVLSVDRLFRATLSTLLNCEENQPVKAVMLVASVQATGADYRPTTLKSCTENLLSSWSQAGWLSAGTQKRRIKVTPLPESVAFALYLGHQEGLRGLSLLDSPYIQAFGASHDTVDELAYQASKLGYLSYRRIADVLEIQFPQVQSPTREQP